MLRLSTRGRYATRFMLELALRYGGGYVLLKDIAQCQDISAGYLEQIIPHLKTSNLIAARRGAKGGYVLARSPRSITLGDVVRAVEGAIDIVDCVNAENLCGKNDACVSRATWIKVSKKINNALDSFSLQDMISQSSGVRKKGGKSL